MNLQSKDLENSFLLGDCRIFPSRNVIERQDGEQHVEPKAMQVLLFLAEKHQSVISRQELLELVWSETCSGEESLNRCISLLRASLGDNKSTRRYIETVSKSGYQLIAPLVLPIEKDTTNIYDKYKKQLTTPAMWAFIVLTIVISLTGYLVWSSHSLITKSSSDEQSSTNKDSEELGGSSIAVMPFVNMSGDAGNEYFSDGISEEILNALAKVPKLLVISRDSAFSFKGKEIVLSEIADKLDVKNILKGSVRKSGDRIRITAQLIEAETGIYLWSGTYDKLLTADSLFTIQDEITAQIVNALKSKLGFDVKPVTRDMTGLTLDAHNEYLQGRYYIEKLTLADSKKALTHFIKATELAPDYAPGWMGKAWAIFSIASISGNPFNKAREAARVPIEKAMQLNPKLAETYVMMAWLKAKNDNEKVPYYEKAIELDPNFTDAYVWLVNATSDFKKKLTLSARARKLDPMSLNTNARYITALIIFGKLEEAETVMQHMIDIAPEDHSTYHLHGYLSGFQGNIGEATFLQEKANAASPDYAMYIIDCTYYFTWLGFTEQAVQIVEGTIYDGLKYKIRGDMKLYLKELRATVPRSANDIRGAWFRAKEEAFLGNTNEALKYFQRVPLSKDVQPSYERIYSHLQQGESEITKKLLDRRRERLEAAIKEGVKVYQHTPVGFAYFDIAILEGNIDKAFDIYEQDVIKKGRPISFNVMNHAMYAKFRAHPKWPTLVKQSQKHMSKQRDIYMKLVAEDTKSNL